MIPPSNSIFVVCGWFLYVSIWSLMCNVWIRRDKNPHVALVTREISSVSHPLSIFSIFSINMDIFITWSRRVTTCVEMIWFEFWSVPNAEFSRQGICPFGIILLPSDVVVRLKCSGTWRILRCILWVLKVSCYHLLSHTSEVCGKVQFSVVSVILSAASGLYSKVQWDALHHGIELRSQEGPVLGPDPPLFYSVLFSNNYVGSLALWNIFLESGKRVITNSCVLNTEMLQAQG